MLSFLSAVVEEYLVVSYRLIVWTISINLAKYFGLQNSYFAHVKTTLGLR